MRNKVIHIILQLVCLLPLSLNAQTSSVSDGIDEALNIITDVVDVVQGATGKAVHDAALMSVTQDVADRIGMLNRILFGSAENDSPVARYVLMYDELYDLTKSVNDYIEYTYSNAKIIEMYCNAIRDEADDGEVDLTNYTAIANQAWDYYEYSRNLVKPLLNTAKVILGKKNMTLSETREHVIAQREEVDELLEAAKRDFINNISDVKLSVEAQGLVKAADIISLKQKDYISVSKNSFGTEVDRSSSSTSTGTTGSLVIVVLGLLCTLYGIYGFVQAMRGRQDAGIIFTRMGILLVVSFAIILTIQKYI